MIDDLATAEVANMDMTCLSKQCWQRGFRRSDF